MIGILDGGVGGLSLARMIMEHFPEAPVLYFGDTARSPYGIRSPETLIRYAKEGAAFLADQGATMLVIASHTVSAAAGETLAASLSIPVADITGPSAREAVRSSRNFRIGVLGTETLEGTGRYERIIRDIRQDAKVRTVASPTLFPLIAEGRIEKPETRMILKRYLRPLKDAQADILIPASSSFDLILKPIREKCGRRIRVIHPNRLLISRIRSMLEKEPVRQTGAPRFSVSDLTPQIRLTSQKYFRGRVHLEAIRLR